MAICATGPPNAMKPNLRKRTNKAQWLSCGGRASLHRAPPCEPLTPPYGAECPVSTLPVCGWVSPDASVDRLNPAVLRPSALCYCKPRFGSASCQISGKAVWEQCSLANAGEDASRPCPQFRNRPHLLVVPQLGLRLSLKSGAGLRRYHLPLKKSEKFVPRGSPAAGNHITRRRLPKAH
jgi:hypothetical protein